MPSKFISGAARRVAVRLVLAVALACAPGMATSKAPEPAADEWTDFGGPFDMIDHTGRAVTDRDYRGRYLLVYFGYTHCPDICPTGLFVMSTALKKLGQDAQKIQPLFISVDARRDTPERLAQYVKAFDSRLVGLTGTRRQIGEAARAYGVFFQAGELDGKYLVDHTARFYLVGPDGKGVAHFEHDIGVDELAAGLLSKLR